ncbi:MAG: hypothetical protein AB7V58_00790 [Solirubrobacterales bacterium]
MKRWHDGKWLVGLGVVALAALMIVAISKTSSGDGGGSSAAEPPRKSSGGKDKASDKAKPSKPAIPTIVVRGGEPVGGVAELSVDAGERARFKVTSDVGDEIHLHGYDISKEIEPGASVTFHFPAEIEGIFEIELEQRAVPIAELQVNP